MKGIEKRYYTIGEVAEHFSVSTSLIRFWEGQFDTIKPRKNKSGVRQYTKEDIEALRTIYHLVKVKGYTLAGAQEVLKGKPKAGDTVQVIESLKAVRQFLDDLKASLQSPAPSNGKAE